MTKTKVPAQVRNKLRALCDGARSRGHAATAREIEAAFDLDDDAAPVYELPGRVNVPNLLDALRLACERYPVRPLARSILDLVDEAEGHRPATSPDVHARQMQLRGYGGKEG